MTKLYGNDDLVKLKQSKPIPITAHTNELVVPVVYADMTKKWLENKGVKLPLTVHQLADMKKEAQSLARGGRVKGRRVKKTVVIGNLQRGKQNQINQQKVIVKLPSTPSAPSYAPSTFASIRPYSTAPMLLADPTKEKKDAEDKDKQERSINDAIERYFVKRQHLHTPVIRVDRPEPVVGPDRPLRESDFDQVSHGSSPAVSSGASTPVNYRHEIGHPMSLRERYPNLYRPIPSFSDPPVRQAERPLRIPQEDLDSLDARIASLKQRLP